MTYVTLARVGRHDPDIESGCEAPCGNYLVGARDAGGEPVVAGRRLLLEALAETHRPQGVPLPAARLLEVTGR